LKRLQAVSAGLLLLALAGGSHAGHDGGATVKSRDLVVGEGAEARSHAMVEVHYTGWLVDGTAFDSSLDRGEPIRFQIGVGQVIPGWELGLLGMRVGGKRELVIPPALAYGARGSGGAVPPNATLRFEIELLALAPGPYTHIDNTELARRRGEGVKLLDIRRPEEWKETGVIEGSVRVTAFDARGRFQESFVEELRRQVRPDEPFALICWSGNRSAMLSQWLATKGGYPGVLNVESGIASWIDEGRPVVP
jgi:rhodanese-related sulfurtransferase